MGPEACVGEIEKRRQVDEEAAIKRGSKDPRGRTGSAREPRRATNVRVLRNPVVDRQRQLRDRRLDAGA